MRNHNIASAPSNPLVPPMRLLMLRVRAAHAEHIFPEINNPTPEQRAAMLHEIECEGLTVHELGEAFADEFQGRRLWCRENCRGTFFVEPIWDAIARCDTGRRFLFSDETDVAAFRLSWSLSPSRKGAARLDIHE